MRKLHLPITLLVYLSLLIFGLGSFALIDWDENIYGAASKSMLETGEYFRIQVNGQAFSEKPPFFFWFANLFYKVLGVSEFSTRLPSVFSGIFSFLILVRFGTLLHSKKFGYVWAFLYSASLLPLLLARTAYIDHLFNTFILASVLSLYLYETKEKEDFRSRAIWILSAAFFGGIAVLTKGPLGLAIPLFIFGANRLLDRNFRIRISDFMLFGIAAVVVLSFYYLANFILYGNGFLVQFFDFQKKLLTKSLESHTGPWFYHFIVMFIGFFPWTALLFPSAKNWKIFTDPKISRISKYFIVWLGVVLLIFSIVQTKLPHYSSSIYFPLSFFAAYMILERPEILKSAAFTFSFLGIGFVVGLIFLLLPQISEYSSSSMGVGKELLPSFDFWDSSSGLVLLLGILIGFIGLQLFKKGNEEGKDLFLASTWISMLIFVGVLSSTITPKIISFLQDGNLRLYDKAEKSGNQIVYYKYLSFYPMFYREKKIHMIGSYKFKDETFLLDSKEKLSIICNRNSVLELVLTYPHRNFQEVSAESGILLLDSSPK
ncbi:glycosyltransferase family 39 protein [Leptospira koniambonensis]|uniref:Glycosyltransferase family 39 protein n=1 Tax=Leptospira koniambonensis TaxID=2484950 RepID=A0A4R9JAP5_9LEPT|nr:glycosyltransferase family 39 protein [Leptospira koniambonensis]TGL36390.1 glycosyltransferase family 39 protein [Leptospira koniambonensis]